MAECLGCKRGAFPFIYLGLPIGASMKRVGSWMEVIDRVNRRLSAWKAKTLSFAGRLVLVKAVLSALPIYFFSLFRAPVAVLKTIDGIRRRFLWGGSTNVKKIRWVEWERILKPKRLGGLGVGNLDDMNLSLLAKWWWRFKESSDQLWVKTIEAIHGGARDLTFIPHKKNSGGVWIGIAAIEKDFMKRGIELQKKIGCAMKDGGTVSFWGDSWVSGGRLKDRFPELYGICRKKKAKVIDNVTPRENPTSAVARRDPWFISNVLPLKSPTRFGA